jgi:uncharacterized membrane protein
MFVVLVALGVVLIALGAIVLISFSDRPEASVKLLGVQVSSAGAGVPLVVLGVLVIVFAVFRSTGS